MQDGPTLAAYSVRVVSCPMRRRGEKHEGSAMSLRHMCNECTRPKDMS